MWFSPSAAAAPRPSASTCAHGVGRRLGLLGRRRLPRQRLATAPGATAPPRLRLDRLQLAGVDPHRHAPEVRLAARRRAGAHGDGADRHRNISIAPDTIRVKAGTTIRWTNYDPLEHNVTSVSGPQKVASGNFGEGGTFQVGAEQARRDPLRVHDPPDVDERHDRSRQLTGATAATPGSPGATPGAGSNSARPASGVEAVA